jgi:hypothetical protein
VSEMRGGLSWSGDKTRPQTSPNCDGQEPSWETSGAKGATRSRQVRSMKSNASEPPKTCRNRILSTSKPGSGSCPGMSMGGACIPPMRRPAQRRRERGPGSDTEPWNLSPRWQGRSPSGQSRKDESTDARHRGRTTRSSHEGRVTRLERRGRVIQSLVNRSTAWAGGTHG